VTNQTFFSLMRVHFLLLICRFLGVWDTASSAAHCPLNQPLWGGGRP
jgi:hypothetical protein